MSTNSNTEVNTSKSSSDLSTRFKQNNLKLETETNQWRLNQEAKKREKQLAKDKIAEEEAKKAAWREKLNTESHPWLSENLNYDKRKEISNKIIDDINHGIDVYSEDYLKATPSTEDNKKVTSSNENDKKVASSNEIKQESDQEKNTFSYKYKTDGRTYVISNAEVDAMEAAYKGHAATLKGRKQRDYIEGYTQILNSLREGKSPSASSQTYSGQHFWSFMDQLKPEQENDKIESNTTSSTTSNTTSNQGYSLRGLLTRDAYRGDYSALEKDFSTPFVRTDQNKLDLEVRLDNLYNAAKNLGYTGEKTEEGLKEYLVRGNHLNSDQFNKYLGIGSISSSEQSPIKLPEGYNIVENGNFFKYNTLLVTNPKGEQEILQNNNGQWEKIGTQGGFRVANDKFSLYVDDFGKIQLTPLKSDPTYQKTEKERIAALSAPKYRETSNPYEFNYHNEQLGIEPNQEIIDITGGFDGKLGDNKIVVDNRLGVEDGQFNNRQAKFYNIKTGRNISGTIGGTRDGKWAFYYTDPETNKQMAYILGNYDIEKYNRSKSDWYSGGFYINPLLSMESDVNYKTAMEKPASIKYKTLDDILNPESFKAYKYLPVGIDGDAKISEDVIKNKLKNDPKSHIKLLGAINTIVDKQDYKDVESQRLARMLYRLYQSGDLKIPGEYKNKFFYNIYYILNSGKPFEMPKKENGGIIKAQSGAEILNAWKQNKPIEYSTQVKQEPQTNPNAVWNQENKTERIGSNDEFAKEWDGHDIVRAGTVGLDAISAIASFIPGAGTAVAMGAGLIATAVDMINDLSDDDIDAATAWKNVGLNLGLTAIGMIPGARFMKLAKSAKSARGLTKSAETAIQAAQKAGKLPIGDIAGEMTQKALRSADDMLKKEGVVKDAIKSLGQANKYIAGGAKVLNAGMMTVGVGHGIASGIQAGKDISNGDGISLDQLRGIIGGIGGLRGLKWKFVDKPAIKTVTKPIGVSDVIEDIPLKKQKFTLVKGKGKNAIKETVEVDYKPGMTPDEVKAAAKLKLQEEGLKLVGVDEARFNKMAELETSDFEIENADNFFKRGTQHISEGLGKVKSKTAKLFVIDQDLDNIEVKSEDELLSSGYGILERHGLNLAKKYGIAPKTSIDAYKQNLETRVPQFQQEEYNKRFMEELNRIQTNKRGGIIKGKEGIDYVTKVADQKPWNNRDKYNEELQEYYSKTDKSLDDLNKFFDRYHDVSARIKFSPESGIAISDDLVNGYQNEFDAMGLHLNSFKEGWAPRSENPLHTGDKWVDGKWQGGDKYYGEATYERTANLFNEAELAKKQEAVKDKGWEWYEDTTHKGRDGRKFYYLRKIPSKKETTTTDTTILKIPTTPDGKKSGIDITAITELPELIGSRLTNKRNYETMMKVTPALPQTYSWYEAVKNNLPYEQLSRKSAAAQLNQAEKQAMNTADPARRQAIMQEASARAQEITDRAAIANQEMYAQTKGQQEQNALKETAMHTDNANQIKSMLYAHKLQQAQLEAGQRTANHESSTRYLDKIKQNADLIQKSRAIEQDKEAQRKAESEMQKLDKSLTLKYPNIDEEVVKAQLEKDVKEAQLKTPELTITEESIKPGTGGKKYTEYYKELLENERKAYSEEYSVEVDKIMSQYNLNKSDYIHPNWVPYSRKSNTTPSTERVLTQVNKKGGQLTYAERASLIKLKASYKQMSDETKNIQKSIDRGQRQVERILDGLSKERYMVVKHMLSK